MTSLRSLLICCALVALPGGCASNSETGWAPEAEYTGSISPTMQEPGDVKYYRSDEPLRMGLEYFGRGAFGTAELHFRDAVEKTPSDRAAWVGLAASYDRLGRFDLADKAYKVVIKLGGETPQVLNNIGYSYMLRGDLRAARAKFDAAVARDPGNPTVLNNIELLNGSFRYVERGPDTIN